MKTLVIIAIALLLTACGGGKTLQVKTERIVVMPPEGLWHCPDAPEPPSGDYTQAEVADYVLQLYEAHKVCDAALDDVREYLEDAKRETDAANDD